MTKLTPELQGRFIDLLKNGVPIKHACIICDIDESTYFIWMKLGRKKTEGKFFEFFKSVDRSRSERLKWIYDQLHKMSNKGNLNALMIQAHREYPDEFPLETQKLDVNHSGAISTFQFIIVNPEEQDNGKPASPQPAPAAPPANDTKHPGDTDTPADKPKPDAPPS